MRTLRCIFEHRIRGNGWKMAIFITILVLLVIHKISFSYNLLIVLLTFFLYALIGFIDDYLIIKYNNNAGLSEKAKFILEGIPYY